MSSVAGYGSSSVSSYYNSYQTQNQPQTQSPTDGFSQILNLLSGTSDGSSGGMGGVDSRSGASGWAKGSSDYQASLDKMLFSAKTNSLGQKGGFENDMKTLSDAINSGDMEAAKKALATIESHRPQKQDNALSTNNQDQRALDFEALQNALNAGDQSAAKTALSTIQDHMKHGKGSHHHFANQLSGGISSNDNQSMSSQNLLAVMMQKMLSQYSQDQAASTGSLKSVSV